VLVEQTIRNAGKFDARSTATVTHSWVKLLNLTNTKSLEGKEFLPLWNVVLQRTIQLIQSDGGFNDLFEISNLMWAYAKAADLGIIKVDGRLLNAMGTKSETMRELLCAARIIKCRVELATLNMKPL
jgi:hypothetical protein